MSDLTARTGRHRQRYDEDGLRLVAGYIEQKVELYSKVNRVVYFSGANISCIPYKLEKNVENETCQLEKKVHVLMITTPNRDDLVFPKGGWEDDESVHEAAHREALEEAGVKGLLDENPLGVWEFRSKSRQSSGSQEGGCRGYMFALEVTEELKSWAEQDKYERRWLSAEEAFGFCRYDWMKDALSRFLNVIRDKIEEVSPSSMDTSESGTGCQTRSSSPVCSSVKQLEESCTKCIVQG